MANNNSTFLSPGTFMREFDLSYRQPGPSPVGAAFIGPTVRGPGMVPIPITSYGEYERWFGTTFSSGSGAVQKDYKFLTTYAVQEYLRYAELAYVLRILAGDFGPAYTNVKTTANSANIAFKLYTLSDGDLANSGGASGSLAGSGSTADEGSAGKLTSGLSSNIRWQVANLREDRGTFDLFIRRGDDTTKRPIVMEQYSQLSLDPNSNNYIARVIGDMSWTLRYDSSGEPYLERSGSYTNRSRLVRVEVLTNTLNYLDNNGDIRDPSLSGSLPREVSGTFAGGSDGNVNHPRAMYDAIYANNTQGYNLAQPDSGSTAYADAIDIFANRDMFDINLLFTPGLIDNLSDHATLITRAIEMCENRGDTFYVVDPTTKGSTVGQAQSVAEARNTNYAAMYYPWVQIPDPDLGRNVWVTPSSVLPGVYSFNDKVKYPWYAPAGLNRGGIDIAINTERFMTQNDRDNLYLSSVNPIATFPKNGICVWGQKTLQKKLSALDRINVRRLLIEAKRFVAQTTKYLLFENNTAETRTLFLQLVEPYFRTVKEQQGLYDFRIDVSEDLNTPEVIDRNELRAKIFLKPAKAIEFIIVDFMVLPTGAAFPTDAKE